ncbi:DUF2933 domain-containing protein [Xanthobacter agilis]|uniref:DUF2933 domain-containing protein n=1 Tax=Xanthobacter agilis TaxID=47492 RepID=A0ABU0LGE3_XANAG|nr:DUF2933 domain-containing protein [Xanthobacter agilis]MDQ0506214.1 hypothetical protein [Xanthobacter agilis]
MSWHDDTGHMPRPGNDTGTRAPHRSFWRSPGGIVAIGFLLAVAFLLFSEHRAHALGYLPFLLLLACPLMHMFMHHGHGHHAGHQPGERTPGPDGGNR